MFSNLNAEMVRKSKTQTDISKILKLNSSTVSDKMTGKRDFKLKECKKIRDSLFPGLTIDYLFAIKEDQEQKQ